MESADDGRRIFSRLNGDFLGLRKETRERLSGLEVIGNENLLHSSSVDSHLGIQALRLY